MPANQFSPVVNPVTAAIASGQQASAAADLAGCTLCGVHMPAAFTGTSLTFQASPTLGGTYQTVQKNGADYAVTVAQGKYVALDPSDFAGIQFLKVVSGSSEGADRTLTLAARPV